MVKLAIIQKIQAIEPVEGIDAIENAVLAGRRLTVRKNQFKIGDLCVYCEISSLLPGRSDTDIAHQKFISSHRLRAQGILRVCFPLSHITKYGLRPGEIGEGLDVTALLHAKGIESFSTSDSSKEVKASFPAFIQKHDESPLHIVWDVLGGQKTDNEIITTQQDITCL